MSLGSAFYILAVAFDGIGYLLGPPFGLLGSSLQQSDSQVIFAQEWQGCD